MKLLRLAALLLTCTGFCFAVSKDQLAWQHLIEDKIDAFQKDTNTKLDNMNGLLNAIQNDSLHNADLLSHMQEAISSAITRSLTPVSGLTNRVDSVGEDVRSLKDALADITARMERMDAKITDLKNQMQIMQSPPPAPSASAPGPGGITAPLPNSPQSGLTSPGSSPLPSSAPAGMSADRSYNDAYRDFTTGRTDLAYNEFQQFLTYFPNTEYAAKAQYYIGEIEFNRNNFPSAIKNFDLVLEHYPENPKTADAHLMKAYALLKANERTRAVQELRTLVSNYPHTDDARKALQMLRTLGLPSSSAPQSGVSR
jgi:tol-pal system protein YbgF